MSRSADQELLKGARVFVHVDYERVSQTGKRTILLGTQVPDLHKTVDEPIYDQATVPVLRLLGNSNICVSKRLSVRLLFFDQVVGADYEIRRMY